MCHKAHLHHCGRKETGASIVPVLGGGSDFLGEGRCTGAGGRVDQGVRVGGGWDDLSSMFDQKVLHRSSTSAK